MSSGLGHLVRWAPLVVCALVATAEVAWWNRAHRTEDELLALAAEGDSRTRVWALHVLANRGSRPNEVLPPSYIQGIIRDEDPLVADLAYTVDFCRLVKPVWQERRLKSRLEDPAQARDDLEDWYRRYALYRRKVGGKPLGAALRLKNQEVRWLLDVLDGKTLDEDVVVDWVTERLSESNQARIHRLTPAKPLGRRE